MLIQKNTYHNVYKFRLNDTKHFLKEIFKNHVFIIFSLINVFIPLYATIMASFTPPNGVIHLIGTGLITSFSTIVNQLLFLLVTSLNYISINNDKVFQHKYRLNIATKYFLILMFSLVSIVCFIILSSVYTEFSAAYQNIRASADYGIKYASLLSLNFIFSSYLYYIINRQWNIKKLYSYIFLALLFIGNVVFIPVFTICINWGENSWIGIGLGQIIPSFIIFLVVLFYIFVILKIKLTKIDFHSIKEYFKYSSNFIVSFLLSTILKTILILAITFALGIAQKSTPIGMMVAKIIWYNSLYFCGFFADGMLYSLEYTKIQNLNDPTFKNITKKNIIIFSSIAIFVTLLINIIFNATTPLIANTYCKDQINPIASPLPKPLELIWTQKYPGVVNANEVFGYLWSPNDGVLNFKLFDKNINNFKVSKSYSLMYMTMFHLFITGSKTLSIKSVKFNQKFDFKGLISSIITTSIVMALIVVIAVAPDNNENFILHFGGIDSFSFASMIVSLLLFLISLMGLLPKKPKRKMKKNIK